MMNTRFLEKHFLGYRKRSKLLLLAVSLLALVTQEVVGGANGKAVN